MKSFVVDAPNFFNDGWALLSAGSRGAWNAMTVSWGGIGTLWGVPAATVYVRPSRYTHEFMDAQEMFTLSFYKEEYRKALGIFGSKSGRDTDKPALAGLTPSYGDGWVTFAEASKTLVCRRMYRQEMDFSAYPKAAVEKFYPDGVAHTMYIGEILDIR